METKQISPEEAGCWIDGHTGHYGSARLILIATGLGWQDEEALNAAIEYYANWGIVDADWDIDPNYIHDAADDAERWMNDNIAPEGYCFVCEDGEFFLFPFDEGEWLN